MKPIQIPSRSHPVSNSSVLPRVRKLPSILARAVHVAPGRIAIPRLLQWIVSLVLAGGRTTAADLSGASSTPDPRPVLGIERRADAVVLRVATSPCLTRRLFSSANLVDWSPRELSPSANASSVLVLTPRTEASTQFFRIAQTRNPGCDPGVGSLPIDSAGLEGYWMLDGDWRDARGNHHLQPRTTGGFAVAPFPRPGANRSYGPTGVVTNNGANSESLTTLRETEGVTLEAWVSLPDDNSGGVLFGFGDGSYDVPKLNVSAAWGFLQVNLGQKGDGATAQYARVGDTCWHHVALVLPKGFRSGRAFRFYLDGEKLEPGRVEHRTTGTNVLTDAATLWGSPFGVGAFLSAEIGPSGGRQKIDEVRLWSRELSAGEIIQLSVATGTGKRCDELRLPPWAPGRRFIPPAVDPVPKLVLGVHVLDDQTIAVITDPNPWLKDRFFVDCGTYFQSLESRRPSLEAWVAPVHYEMGVAEVVQHYRPTILAALGNPQHLRFSGPGLVDVRPAGVSLWPQATREFRVPRAAPGEGEEHVPSAEVVYYSYCKLPFRLRPGATYRVTDAWNNQADWTYDEDRTISWALKVNQVGYLPDAPEKYGYLGSWLGPQGGALDLARFEGAPFQVCRDADGEVVFTGRVEFRGDETVRVVPPETDPIVLSGEKVYQLDFSAFRGTGYYYLRVPGVGRSWRFEVGQNAMGESFHVHARGLYHQRCGMPLEAAHTAWVRGACHTNTYRAGFPTDDLAYHKDSVPLNWGMRDAAGLYPRQPDNGPDATFEAVNSTRTSELLPWLRGGWHDAGDYDRAGFRHLITVKDLTVSYLLFPENFTDGQLNLPESGNGIPDLLDEAVWGMEVWRRAQESDGRVALHIEAESHPHESDPARDPARYYLGLASHGTSFAYAEHAARLARALALAGANNPARLYVESARRAYAFGVGDPHRISATLTVWDQAVTWSEFWPVDPKAQFRALIQLWLATGAPDYRAALDSPAMAQAWQNELNDLVSRTSGFDYADVVLAPDRFPSGWAELARHAIQARADFWISSQAIHAYRKVWYAPTEGYFGHLGWGNAGFRHLRELVAAWRITGDARYRAAALLGVDWMHGANPQGRVNTTGLGANSVVHPLQLPADADDLPEPMPGISIYGYTPALPFAAPRAVYGLEMEPREFDGFSLPRLAQLPPPWNDPTLPAEVIAKVLQDVIPLWRRIIALEGQNVPQMEFGLNETIGHAAAVCGCLMGPGWRPSEAQSKRRPKSAAELQESLWYHP